MNILFVGYRDPRHSSAGGYDGITKLPGSHTLWDKDVLFGSIPMHQRGKVINTFFLDLKARAVGGKYDVVHYFYGDMLLFPFNKNRNYKLVTTIHQDFFSRDKMPNLFLKTLKSLDGVITLSSEQQKELEGLNIKASFIPHGFNHPVFEKKAMDIDHNKINIVVLGSNYRDWDTLYRTIDYCAEENNNIMFHLLGQPKTVKDSLREKKNVICYPRLIDDDYYSLIAACDYSFLPLTFATANNALLEAEFLGVKSILPSISGISDYASEDYNLFYSSPEQLYVLFKSLKKGNLCLELKEYAKRFLWENVFLQLNEYYKSL